MIDYRDHIRLAEKALLDHGPRGMSIAKRQLKIAMRSPAMLPRERSRCLLALRYIKRALWRADQC